MYSGIFWTKFCRFYTIHKAYYSESLIAQLLKKNLCESTSESNTITPSKSWIFLDPPCLYLCWGICRNFQTPWLIYFNQSIRIQKWFFSPINVIIYDHNANNSHVEIKKKLIVSLDIKIYERIKWFVSKFLRSRTLNSRVVIVCRLLLL